MNRFKRMLCVIDPTKVYLPALERAIALAQRNQATVAVVAVIDPATVGSDIPGGGPLMMDLRESIVRAYRQRLESSVAPYHQRVAIEIRVLIGVPSLEIIRTVLRDGNDLVVKIAETMDWLDRSFSSNDMHLLRKCPCPVLLIKPRGSKSYRRILAAVDVGYVPLKAEAIAQRALNRQILEMAGSLAFADSAELDVVHVWNAIGEEAMRDAVMSTPEGEVRTYIEHVRRWHESSFDELMREVASDLGSDTTEYSAPRIHLEKGRAQRKIPVLAKRIGIDLVVMGTVIRTGTPGFIIGNTAETILNQLDCSVLALKPPGFVTPVSI